MQLKNCLACGSDALVSICKFPDMPLTDAYLSNKNASLNQSLYPLSLSNCSVCSHLQLDYLVSPEDSYTDYLYQSNVTPGLTSSFNEYAKFLVDSVDSTQLTVLDIGSNDGSFLNSCRNEGLTPYGVEPNIYLASVANKFGLNTLQAFFDSNIFSKLADINFPLLYDFVTFNNVFANLPDPKGALIQAKSLLKSHHSSIVIQTGYHPEQFRNKLFDYVYHEHYSYFSISSIAALAQSVDLHISGYHLLPIRGGTLRIELSLSPKPSSPRQLPPELFISSDSLSKFFLDSFVLGTHLKDKLQTIKLSGQPIVGFGSSHSTGVMVHSFGLASLLDYIIDENTLKHNRFMPGTDLEVRPISALTQDSVVVVLAHQYYKSIEFKLRQLPFHCQIIHPMVC